MKPIDGGNSWIDWGLSENSAMSVTALVVSGKTIYAGTWGGTGVFRRSTGGDDSWAPINRGLTELPRH